MKLESNLTLGQFLRQERERRGITIEQVASSTKIGVKTIHALEGDHYSELPAKPFVRGFVISYARFIGLDYKEVLTHYSGFLEEKVHDRPARDAGHSGYAFEKREGEQSRTYLGLAMGGFVLIGGLAFLVLKPGLHHHHGSHLDKLREMHPSEAPSGMPTEVAAATQPSPAVSVVTAPVAATPTPTPSATKTSAPTPTPTPTPTPSATVAAAAPIALAKPSPQALASSVPSPSPSPTATEHDPLNSGISLKASEIVYRVVFKAVESVWIRYKVDDRQVMQFVFKKDKVLVLRAKSSIIVQVGRPEDIQLTYKGTGYHLFSDDPKVATIHDDATLFFPAQLAENNQDPFPKSKALSARPAPVSPTATPSPTETE